MNTTIKPPFVTVTRKCHRCGITASLNIQLLDPEIFIDVQLTADYRFMSDGWRKGWFNKWTCGFCNKAITSK